MRAFACTVCGRLVTFESSHCLHCGSALGFDPVAREIVALRPADDGDGLIEVASGAPRRWRCANAGLVGCNWLARAAGGLCDSCALTRTRPADDDREGIELLTGAESAKRRLLFELRELGLPIRGWQEGAGGLGFDLLSSAEDRVVTGHAGGLITLDLAEQDGAHREAVRERLSEPYRTVLGHLRHEVGHYLWTVVVAGTPLLGEARSLFGDEREDYAAALERHYAEGAPDGWHGQHVSAYATMHPAEDWAETFAHYLHIWDTLQTAAAYRVSVDGPLGLHEPVAVDANRIVAPEPGAFHDALDQWLPLTYALNALNRSMGSPDLYPFVLAPAVLEKLVFVDRTVAAAGG